MCSFFVYTELSFLAAVTFRRTCTCMYSPCLFSETQYPMGTVLTVYGIHLQLRIHNALLVPARCEHKSAKAPLEF